jgi:hypothetical protein
MVDKSSDKSEPIDKKHAEQVREAAKRAAEVLKKNPPPDTLTKDDWLNWVALASPATCPLAPMLIAAWRRRTRPR